MNYLLQCAVLVLQRIVAGTMDMTGGARPTSRRGQGERVSAPQRAARKMRRCGGARESSRGNMQGEEGEVMQTNE
jgi:hypothetical protein